MPRLAQQREALRASSGWATVLSKMHIPHPAPTSGRVCDLWSHRVIYLGYPDRRSHHPGCTVRAPGEAGAGTSQNPPLLQAFSLYSPGGWQRARGHGEFRRGCRALCTSVQQISMENPLFKSKRLE
jgi:hypothetical protein